MSVLICAPTLSKLSSTQDELGLLWLEDFEDFTQLNTVDCFLQPFLPVWEEHEDIIMETRRSLRLDQKRKDQKPTHQGASEEEDEDESWKEKPSSYSSKRRKSSTGSEITIVAETVMRHDTSKEMRQDTSIEMRQDTSIEMRRDTSSDTVIHQDTSKEGNNENVEEDEEPPKVPTNLSEWNCDHIRIWLNSVSKMFNIEKMPSVQKFPRTGKELRQLSR